MEVWKRFNYLRLRSLSIALTPSEKAFQGVFLVFGEGVKLPEGAGAGGVEVAQNEVAFRLQLSLVPMKHKTKGLKLNWVLAHKLILQ